MEINLTEPQSEFFMSDSKYTAAVAGFGSGKTEIALTRMMANMIEEPGIDQLYCAPTYPLIRDIWYPKIETTLEEMNLKFNINESKHVIYIQGLGKILCKTMERPESIIGFEVADAFLDEFDVLATNKALHVFRKVSARLRQKKKDKKKNQLFVTTTPEGFKATYKLFKKEPLNNSRLIQMSTYSNAKNLPDDYIDDLKDQYPNQLIEAYLLGKFVNLTSGTVYHSFDRKIHFTKYVAKPREPLHIGMDFNVYKMAAIVHIVRNGIPYAINEFVNVRDTPDMIEVIKETYPDHHITIYPDASGDNKSAKSSTTSDHTLLKDAGFAIRSRKANPAIKNRVQSLNKKFEDKSYYINGDMCPQYVEAIEQQVYNESTGQPEKDGDLDNKTDAGGYFIYFRWPILKREFKETILRGV